MQQKGNRARRARVPAAAMIKPLTIWGKLFFALVNLAGGTVYLWVLAHAVLRPSEPRPWGYVALFIMALVAGVVSVKIPGINSLISLSDTFVACADGVF